MAKNSYKIKKSLNLQAIPTTAIAIDQAGDLAFDSTLDKLQLQDSVGTHSLVTEDVVATLTNKTLTSPFITSPTGITKADVGLSNVDNTSDATKNSAAVTLTNKTITSPVITTPTGIVKGDVGLANVDNTSDATKNSATATLTNKTLTSPIITSPIGITKTDIGLSQVDNTSDITKNSLVGTLANKTIDGTANTISNISLTTAVTGTLPIANGGTGQTTANTALNALLPAQSGQSGNYLTTNGTNTSWTAAVSTAPNSEVWVSNGNGYGGSVSGDVVVRNFVNIIRNTGTDITYTARTITTGDVFKINTAGTYAISYSDNFNVGGTQGLSLNASSGSTVVGSLPIGEIIGINRTASTNFFGTVTAIIRLSVNDLIRAQTGGDMGGSPDIASFRITRIA